MGYAQCEATYPTPRPPVPYASQTKANTLGSEQGFKTVRGQLTEGRYLTFEMNGYALQNNGKGGLVSSRAHSGHGPVSHRFVVHQVTAGGNQFKISSARDGQYITGPNSIGSASKAVVFTINDLGNGVGYSLFNTATKKYETIHTNGEVGQKGSSSTQGFQLFSVTYDNLP